MFRMVLVISQKEGFICQFFITICIDYIVFLYHEVDFFVIHMEVKFNIFILFIQPKKKFQ